MVAHIRVAEVLLYEIALHDDASLEPNERLEVLWACLHAIKAFLSNRFTFEDHGTPKFICLSAVDVMYCFLTGLKLIMLANVPGWDRSRARDELEYDHFMLQQVEQMQRAVTRRNLTRTARQENGGSVGQLDVESDPFARLAKRLLQIRQCLVAEFDRIPPTPAAMPTPVRAPATPMAGPAGPMCAEEKEAEDAFMVDIDETGWQELFATSSWDAWMGGEVPDLAAILST